MGKIRKHKEMDMLNGGVVGKLIMFAIPLACSSILQQRSDVYRYGSGKAGIRSFWDTGQCDR